MIDGVMLPATVRRSDGVDDPIPTLPLAKIVKSDVPVDDATLNGLRLDVEVACTLKTKDDDVALMPENTPLSRSDDVPRVVAVSQRVAKPIEPPVTPAPMTPNVLVAVLWRIWPRVPTALVES